MARPTVVIVNYNGGDTLLACLRALEGQTMRPDVVVVDNASRDDSLTRAAAGHPGVRVIPLRANSGFARAFNIGVSRIDASDGVVVALNPDTLPAPGFVEALTRPLLEHDDLGSVAGTLTFTRSPDTIASAGIQVHRNGVALDARLGESLSLLRETDVQPIFGPSGGAAAYRLGAFRGVGGFCEPFFMYLEDVDLAWRMRLAGLESAWSPAAVALHDYSAAAGEGSPFKRRLIARNRIWTLARCLPSEIWRRDRASIVGFDLLAAGWGIVTLDPGARGRLEAIAALPLRLREGTMIRRASSVPWQSIDRWILPPADPRELRRLRALTGKLASESKDDNR